MQPKGRPATEIEVHMQPKSRGATEIKKTPKAVYKRPQTKKMMEHEAENEEAAEIRTQQECILSGGVHLRHRLEKQAFQKSACSAFPRGYYTSTVRGVQCAAFGRSGVQETVPLSD
jgi:hypothetical protein